MSSPPDSFTEEELEVALILQELPKLVLEAEAKRRSLRRWGFKKKRSPPSQDASPPPPPVAAIEDGKSKPATLLFSHPTIGVEDSSAPEMPPLPVKQDEEFMRRACENGNGKREDLVMPSQAICPSPGRGPAEGNMGGVSAAFSVKRPSLILDLNKRPDEQEEI